MHLYQLKIVIKKNKTDQFVDNLYSLSRGFRKEKGCLEYSVYRDSEKENTYNVVGEYKTRQAMEKHFQTQNFEVLTGVARVLGETFEMNIADVLKTGGFNLHREQLASRQRGRTASN